MLGKEDNLTLTTSVLPFLLWASHRTPATNTTEPGSIDPGSVIAARLPGTDGAVMTGPPPQGVLRDRRIGIPRAEFAGPHARPGSPPPGAGDSSPERLR
jgi:hypothetical protein